MFTPILPSQIELEDNVAYLTENMEPIYKDINEVNPILKETDPELTEKNNSGMRLIQD